MGKLTFPLSFSSNGVDKPTFQLTSIAKMFKHIFASDVPSFSNKLQTTLVPQFGYGDLTPTLTRATAATQTGFDGNLNQVLSGEVRFNGSRRVRNLLTFTEDFSNAIWVNAVSGTGTSAKTPNYGVAPDGSTTAARIVLTKGSGYGALTYSIVGGFANEQRVHSVWVKSNTASSQVFGLGDGIIGYDYPTATTSWKRFSYSNTNVSANTTFTIISFGSADAALDLLIWHPQLEKVTTQTNQNPSEYVPALATANVDSNAIGVRYFDTLNGNTVASNVVTEATGAPIATSGKFGVLPGVAGAYFSTPDSVAASITGDIDIRWIGSLSDWTPANLAFLTSKWSSAPNLSYVLYINSGSTGIPLFSYSPDGTTVRTTTCDSAVSFADGTIGGIRVTYSTATGKVNFYTSADGGTTWILLGAEKTITAGAVADGNATVAIGADSLGNAASVFAGRAYRAQIYNGINGTLAVDFNPNLSTSAQTFTAATGEVWTTNGGARIYGNTDATYGIPAPWDAGGPYGYLAEGLATNLLLQSNAFTTTWTVLGTPTPTQNATGPDGIANSAWTLTDNDAGVGEAIFQIISLAATTTYTASIFIKKTTGAQTSYPVIVTDDGATHAGAVTIDTSNGVATVWTAYTGLTIFSSSAAIYNSNSAFWRVSLTYTTVGAGATSHITIYPAGTTNATQSTGVPDVTAQGSAVFYGAQLETGSIATSYIPTTTVAVARNADVLTYASAGNISGTQGTAYAEVVLNTRNAANVIIQGSSAEGAISFFDATGRHAAYDVTATRVLGTNTYALNAMHKAAVSYSGVVISGVGDGALDNLSPTAFDGNFNIGASFGVGVSTDALNSLGGTLRFLRIYPTALPASKLQSMTSP